MTYLAPRLAESALTVAALRPDLLRVTIVSSGQPILAGDSLDWNHVDGNWDI